MISELLSDRSHHIEFNGHLTNHNKHAVIALLKLGAKEERIKEFYYNYANETPYGYGLEPARSSKYKIDERNWKDYLGKRTSFSGYYEFFESQYDKFGLQYIVDKYLLELLDGWVGSLTHALIHLGWGLDIDSKCMILEGFAYLAFSYVAIGKAKTPARKNNESTPLESIINLAKYVSENTDEFNAWQAGIINEKESIVEKNIHPELARSGLQYRIAKVLGHSHQIVHATPAWFSNNSSPQNWAELYKAVTLIYLSRPGDFLLLHLITSLNAMEKVSRFIRKEDSIECITLFWKGVISILFAMEQPISFHALTELLVQYQERYDDESDSDVLHCWDVAVTEAIAEDEEHNTKMVYVVLEQWKKSGHLTMFRDAALCFTATPELPKSFETPPLYT